MSHNFLFNNIDIVNKRHPNKTHTYENYLTEILKTKKNINKLKKYVESNNDKKIDLLKEKQDLINLEESYKNSLILLEMIKKQTEKNIFEKYDINNYDINNKDSLNSNNNDVIKNILMKKKFLITTP